MPWKGPDERCSFPSLGWEILEWIADFLPSPRDDEAPFICTDDQARLIIRWYQVHPVTGRFVYRRGCSRRSKGVGKSPLEAVKDIVELAGPVVFDGWDADGEPVARPWGTGGLPAPWVQVAACSEDQTDNIWSVLHHLLTTNDGRAADNLRIDTGLTRCFLRDRQGKAEPVTAAAGSREGQPITYASLEETHLWTPSSGGVRLAATLRRNVAKMGGRTYETTNSFVPGEGSVAEGTQKAIDGGQGIFVDAVEAPTVVGGTEVTADASDEVLRQALKVAYGDAPWVDLDRIVQEIRDPDMRWEDAQRFFFNWNRKGEGRAVDPARWAELARPDRVVAAGERVGLGFDGSISDDSTALIACTVDGYSFVVDVWERPLGAREWRVPRLDVHAAVARAFETWDVGLMLCDPPKWWTEIEEWSERWPDRVVVLDTNSVVRFAPAVDRWLTAIAEGSHTHSGEDVLRRHVEAAARKKVRAKADDDDGRTKYVITKGDDRRKIDAAVADVLAFQAAMTMPAPDELVIAAGWL